MTETAPVTAECRECGAQVAVVVGGLALSGEQFSQILSQLREQGRQPTFADSDGRFICPNCSAIGHARP